MENQGRLMISNVWKMMTIHSFSSKTNYTNKFSIPKLRENSLFLAVSITHSGITHDPPTFTNMENQGKSMIINVILKNDDHTLIFIQNILYQYVGYGKFKDLEDLHFVLFIFLTTMDLSEWKE